MKSLGPIRPNDDSSSYRLFGSTYLHSDPPILGHANNANDGGGGGGLHRGSRFFDIFANEEMPCEN